MKLSITIALLLASTLCAQTPSNSAGTAQLAKMVATNIVKSAEKMPEDKFAFKPTPDVRSYAQLLGHIADAQYSFCSVVVGEKPTPVNAEKTMTKKAELVSALKAAFDYCDKAYASVTDANSAQAVKFFGGERTKLTVLNFNAMHNFEHYGNVVTYLRLQSIVPPSSEGR